MADDIASALQKGLIAALKADTDLSALVAGRVYDEPPQRNLVYPYLRINGLDTAAFDTDSTKHELVQISLEAHSQSAQGRTEAARIAGAVKRALHQQEAAVTVEGFHVIELIYQTSLTGREPEGRGHFARIALQAWLQPIA